MPPFHSCERHIRFRLKQGYLIRTKTSIIIKPSDLELSGLGKELVCTMSDWSASSWWHTLVGRPTRGARMISLLALLVGFTLSFRKCVSLFRANVRRPRLLGRRQQFQEECLLEIYKLEESLASRKVSQAASDKITRLGTSALARALLVGDLCPSDVLLAFQHKALDVHRRSNCIVQPLSGAQELAGVRDEQDPADFPLFGLPVSLADDIQVKGYVSTGGGAADMEEPCHENSPIVQMLKKRGAICFMKTNASRLSCGSDSDGETSLVGGGGSVIGIGNDVGGAQRLSAHLNGVVCFKPSAGRISSRVTEAAIKDIASDIVPAGIAMLSRDVDGALLISRSLMSEIMFRTDPYLPPIPFIDQDLDVTRTLTVGIWSSDGMSPPNPANETALLKARAALTSLNHESQPQPLLSSTSMGGKPEEISSEEKRRKDRTADTLPEQVVWWSPPQPTEAFSLYVRTLLTDAYTRGHQQKTADDVIDSSLQWLLSLVRRLGISTHHHAPANQSQNDDFSNVPKRWSAATDLKDYMKLKHEVERYRRCFLEEWRSAGLDGLLCPVHPSGARAAGAQEHTQLGIAGLSYVGILSLLDLPTGVLPVLHMTDVGSDVQVMTENETSDENMTQLGSNPSCLPVGIQIASLPWREEVCLRLLRDLEGTLATDLSPF